MERHIRRGDGEKHMAKGRRRGDNGFRKPKAPVAAIASPEVR
jgi:hypothetical protein